MKKRYSAKSSIVLDRIVDATVKLCSELFKVKSFTRSGLTLGLMIAYVYVALLLLLLIIRITFKIVIELLAWSNALGLRNAIARERGIAAYRAWVPLERIRPSVIPQEKWEEAFAWPANNAPPYPPLARRILRVGVISKPFTYKSLGRKIRALLDAWVVCPKTAVYRTGQNARLSGGCRRVFRTPALIHRHYDADAY